jgi:hypothetical protein
VITLTRIKTIIFPNAPPHLSPVPPSGLRACVPVWRSGSGPVEEQILAGNTCGGAVAVAGPCMRWSRCCRQSVGDGTVAYPPGSPLRAGDAREREAGYGRLLAFAGRQGGGKRDGAHLEVSVVKPVGPSGPGERLHRFAEMIRAGGSGLAMWLPGPGARPDPEAYRTAAVRVGLASGRGYGIRGDGHDPLRGE